MGYQDQQQQQQQQHHQQPTAEAAAHASHAPHTGGGSGGGPDDVRPTHVFTGYLSQAYPDNSNSPSGPTPPHHLVAPPRTGSATAVASTAVITAPVPRRKHHRPEVEPPEGLFPNLPEAKKRKFILVDDSVRGSRLRVRVTLDGVDTNEIPDSFRRSASVFPRSYFPREMQSPPPSPTGRRFFGNDLPDEAGDGEETEGRGLGRRGGGSGSGSGSSGSQAVDLAMSMGMGMGGREGSSCHPGAAALGVHRMRKSRRGREIKLNDLAGRMAWLQSRVFAGRPVFLQRALDTYRNRTKAAIESTMQDVTAVAPHFETRAGKRRWNARREASEE
ncbi:hypothetical protein E4U13_002394 [Claviceps humidiphila]|uniref:DUF8032 domain-containing protein n=1 Tax=Claviceps humidiphila TaxID=1294629 RepID=A0A9P7PZY2_9HYPO|nr:hypothetical protein E4U13_002394 [Claviceps humidiphila]